MSDATPTPTRVPSGRSFVRDAALMAGLAIVYFLAGRFGLSLAFVNASASAVWPPTGIAIAALVLLGPRFWPAIAVGAFLTNLDSSGHVASSTAIAVGNTLEGVVGAVVVRRWADGRRAFQSTRGVFVFFAAAVGAPLMSASLGVASLVAFGLAPSGLAGSIWLTWWLGDVAGALVLAPAILLLWPDGEAPRMHRRVETAACLVVTAAAAMLVWGPWARVVFADRPVSFVMFPFVVWAALRLGPRATALAVLAMDAAAIGGTLRGHGPFVLSDPNHSLLYLQAFLGVISLVTLPTAAITHQQGVARRQLREAAEGLAAQVEARTAELAASRAALQRSLDSVHLAERATGRGSWQWDITTDRATWSEGMYLLFGLDPRTFTNSNENFLALVHPEDRERMGQAIADALARPGRFLQEYRLTRPDGRRLSVRGEGNVIVDPDGKPRRLFGFVQDVTDLRAAEDAREAAERALRDSEQRLRKLFAANPAGLILTRRDGTVIDLNPAAERLWGRTRAQFLDPAFRSAQLFADPSEREGVVAAVQEAGGARDLELRMTRGDGTVRRMLFNIEVLELAGERVFLASGQDVTALREAEERFRLLFDANPVAVVMSRADGKGFVQVNDAYARLVGFTRKELLDPAFDPTRISADPKGRARLIESLRRDGGADALEIGVRRKDGQLRTAVASVRTLEVDGQPCFLTALQDVTEAREAEDALRRAQERFASVFRASPVAIALSKQDGTFVDVNDALCTLVGRSRDDLLSGRAHAPEVWEDPEERKRMLNAIRERGLVRDLELRIKRPDGQVRTTLASIEFVDVGGDTTILSMLQDITDRLRMQEEREARIASEAELERLRRTDRFRTEFINNIAHELATPLTPLVLKSKVLLADKTLTLAQQGIAETLERNIQRLRHFVDDMVGAADLQARTLALDRRRLNLTRELRAAVAAHHPAAERAGLTMDEPEDTGLTVSADPARIQLVLGHLLGNAIKFTPTGGRVTVASRRVGDEVRIEVKDTGVGLTTKQMEGLWRPFSQAHDKSQKTDSGSGLGLYVTKGIIELHGGEVGCSSPGAGKGSTFWFTLPLAVGHLDPLSRPRTEPVDDGPRRNLNPGVEKGP